MDASKWVVDQSSIAVGYQSNLALDRQHQLVLDEKGIKFVSNSKIIAEIRVESDLAIQRDDSQDHTTRQDVCWSEVEMAYIHQGLQHHDRKRHGIVSCSVAS